MAKLKEELWKTLMELKEEEFKDFKWFLEQDNFPGIQRAQLEKAKRRDTVDLIVQTYQDSGAQKVTMKVLEKLNRNDLVQRLQNSSLRPKDVKTLSALTEGYNRMEDELSEHQLNLETQDLSDQEEDYERKKDELKSEHQLNLETQDLSDQEEDYERKKDELKSVQHFAVEVTLDPDTAHPSLILSGDGKQVHHGDVRKNLPYKPQRFLRCVNVLGKQSFSSGRFYFEVQVKGKTAWTLGVASESVDRKGQITLSPENGFWTLWLRNRDEYVANDNHPVHLSLKNHPQVVGLFLNYEEGLVSFYDVNAADLLYSFTDCSFTEKLYPFFSPCTNDNGRNSAPLIISPVKHQLNLETQDLSDQKEDYERKKDELKSVQQFAVEVTLDPDTAHPSLILSGDGKQVRDGDVRKNLPYKPQRFHRCVNVLGKQSFSSGRFYFEVQVKGKTAWTLGVASESVDRKGQITLSPECGFWTTALSNGKEFVAVDEPTVCRLKSRPQKVGVFVDYEEGLVSFYDVNAADLLYSFTDCSFTEKLYPFFSPCTNDNGRNSAPLIICPVNSND